MCLVDHTQQRKSLYVQQLEHNWVYNHVCACKAFTTDLAVHKHLLYRKTVKLLTLWLLLSAEQLLCNCNHCFWLLWLLRIDHYLVGSVCHPHITIGSYSYLNRKLSLSTKSDDWSPAHQCRSPHLSCEMRPKEHTCRLQTLSKLYF